MKQSRGTLRSLMQAALLGTAVFAVGAASSQRMTQQDARGYFEKVLPLEAEQTYKMIPWRLTVLEAVVEAQLSDKPILLWQKRGQPMGFV